MISPDVFLEVIYMKHTLFPTSETYFNEHGEIISTENDFIFTKDNEGLWFY